MNFDNTAFRLSGEKLSLSECADRRTVLQSIIEKEMLFIDAVLHENNREVGDYLAHVLYIIDALEQVLGIAPHRLSQWQVFYKKALPLEVSEFHIQRCQRKLDELQRLVTVTGS